MCEKFGYKVYEIRESMFSKKELRERIEKMLEEYPDNIIFDRVFAGIALSVSDDNEASLTPKLD